MIDHSQSVTARRSVSGKAAINQQLDLAVKDYTTKYQVMEESSQNAVRLALVEERSRYCTFVSYLKPVLVSQPVVWIPQTVKLVVQST